MSNVFFTSYNLLLPCYLVIKVAADVVVFGRKLLLHACIRVEWGSVNTGVIRFVFILEMLCYNVLY